MKKIILKNIFIFSGAVIVLAICYFAYQIETPLSLESEPKKVEIKKGTGFLEIAEILEKNKIIRSKNFFKIYVLFKGWQKELKAGNYLLCPCVSISEIAKTLVEGEKKEEVKVTIVEGWSIFEIDKKLSEEKIIYPNSLISYQPTESQKERYPFLLEISKNNSIEGFLFPGEYDIFFEDSKIDIYCAFVNNFFDALPQDYEELVNKQELSLYEAVILASMIQREVIHPEEAPLIAGVFINRLDEGMPLQSDPTVQYAIADNAKAKSWWKSPLEGIDLRVRSPFNTYTNSGLPPAPICSPDLNSLLAVAYPEVTDYLYFRASCDHSGSHNFSVTYEQHLAAACD